MTVTFAANNSTMEIDHVSPNGEACRIVPMHHFDDDGTHYCPTGFLWCSTHGDVAGTHTGDAPCP